MVFKVVDSQAPNLGKKLINVILLLDEELIQILQSLRILECFLHGKSRPVI